MTYQLIYSSLFAIPMQREELQASHKRARSAKRAKGITSALVYVDGCFLQVLEGEIGPVRDLMERTSRDVRHEEVTILQAAKIADPVFPQWDMAYVSVTPEQVAEWVGFSPQAPLREILEDMRQDRQRSERVPA